MACACSAPVVSRVGLAGFGQLATAAKNTGNTDYVVANKKVLSTGAKIVMSNIDERVLKMVAEQLGVKEEDVKPDSSFVDDLGADSLDTVELIMALEEEFDTEIPDEDAEKLATVQDAIDYINKNLN